MAIEAISGAGMAYQGSSSSAEIKSESQVKIHNTGNELASNQIAKETMALNTKETSSDGSGESGARQQGAEQTAQIKKAVDEINKSRTGSQAEAIFGIHEETNRVTIKIVDKQSKKVIKEYPPEQTLDMIAKAWELAGIMVDEKR